MKPGKHQKTKQRRQDLSCKVHDLAQSSLCKNYVTNAILLVSSTLRSKQLLYFVHGQGQKKEQKHTTKKFVEFHNHFPFINYAITESNASHVRSIHIRYIYATKCSLRCSCTGYRSQKILTETAPINTKTRLLIIWKLQSIKITRLYILNIKNTKKDNIYSF